MRSILSTLLFISGIAGAAWSQTPYNERTDDLGDGVGANLCWETDGRFDVRTGGILNA